MRAVALALACAGTLTAGCESAAEKCEKARAAAATAWGAYVTELEKARAAAAIAQSDSQRKLSAEIEPRLSPAVQKLADSRYDRSSDAWVRAQKFALHEACKSDAECSAQKRRNDDAQVAITDLDERLPLARAAAAAISGPIAQAPAAADAVIIHAEYPGLKAAQQASRVAHTLCAAVDEAR